MWPYAKTQKQLLRPPVQLNRPFRSSMPDDWLHLTRLSASSWERAEHVPHRMPEGCISGANYVKKWRVYAKSSGCIVAQGSIVAQTDLRLLRFTPLCSRSKSCHDTQQRV